MKLWYDKFRGTENKIASTDGLVTKTNYYTKLLWLNERQGFLLGIYYFSNGDYQNYFIFWPLYKFLIAIYP